MPNRGSQNVHDNDYNWLKEIYGETCLICGKPPATGLRLEVDHIYPDKKRWDTPANKSLVCPQCNSMLRGIDALAPQYPALTPFKLGSKGNRWGLMPPVAWLKNIVESCDAAGTKVFIKDNLISYLYDKEMSFDDITLFWEADKVGDRLKFRNECGARQAPAEGAR